MRFLTSPEMFLRCQSTIDTLIAREKHLPEQVFKDPLSGFAFISADDIFHTPLFFERIKSFLEGVGESRWYLAVIEPDPKEYFFHHFGKYSIVEMTTADTDEGYLRIAQEDPGNSPADAIGFNSRLVLLFSDSRRWAIYADRDYELGVAAFAEKELRSLFTSIYRNDKVLDVNEAIEQIVKTVFSNRAPSDGLEFQRKLIANYGLRTD